jgi:hypothetical protein
MNKERIITLIGLIVSTIIITLAIQYMFSGSECKSMVMIINDTGIYNINEPFKCEYTSPIHRILSWLKSTKKEETHWCKEL